MDHNPYESPRSGHVAAFRLSRRGWIGIFLLAAAWGIMLVEVITRRGFTYFDVLGFWGLSLVGTSLTLLDTRANFVVRWLLTCAAAGLLIGVEDLFRVFLREPQPRLEVAAYRFAYFAIGFAGASLVPAGILSATLRSADKERVLAASSAMQALPSEPNQPPGRTADD